jgi:iron complex outermembrane receptor protein
VNTIDKRIADSPQDPPITGVLDLAAGSVSEERSGASALQVGRGPLVVRGEYSRRDTNDVAIPSGTLANSAVESESAGASVSFVDRRGFVGVSARTFDTLYGVPGGHEDEGAEEAPVRIDLDQRRVDIRGGYTQPFGAFRAAKLRFGIAEYEHVELEGDEVGTRFGNDGWEGRLELLHKPVGALRGSFGAQVFRRDFDVIGAEAFLPPSRTRTWALFAFEEVGTGSVKGQAGLRYERQTVDARGEAPARRSEGGLSGSAGLVWETKQGFGAALTVARSVKLPNAEELYANGPHIATRAFEIGAPDLRKEQSLGVDLALRQHSGQFRGQLTLFANRFDDYIFDQVTGEEEDGLQVVQFVQKDARFMGGELEGHFDLLEKEPHHLDVELSADLVRAQLTDDHQDLPRIPPIRYGAALHYRSHIWNARIEARGAATQNRVGPFERPTEGYTWLNASVGYRIFAGKALVDLVLRGTNLTDKEARVHTSYLKDLVPLPGRDVRLNARLTF